MGSENYDGTATASSGVALLGNWVAFGVISLRTVTENRRRHDMQ